MEELLFFWKVINTTKKRKKNKEYNTDLNVLNLFNFEEKFRQINEELKENDKMLS